MLCQYLHLGIASYSTPFDILFNKFLTKSKQVEIRKREIEIEDEMKLHVIGVGVGIGIVNSDENEKTGTNLRYDATFNFNGSRCHALNYRTHCSHFHCCCCSASSVVVAYASKSTRPQGLRLQLHHSLEPFIKKRKYDCFYSLF
jgi:hypothetical protein